MGRCNAIPKMEICIKFHIGFSLVSFFGNGNVCEDNEKEQEWERKRPLANIEHLVSHFISLKFICEPVCRHSKALDARWMLIFIIIISLRIIFQFCFSCVVLFSVGFAAMHVLLLLIVVEIINSKHNAIFAFYFVYFSFCFEQSQKLRTNKINEIQNGNYHL